ncbi:Peroxinectin A [Gracilariopsis chorda]|uniref:Peroxinectin A n=1 Tax=Gracilariopsis chorda TaxID=448386 RepID=A0A2V3IJ79_9FLOR|nr:Peroxinectin A [Gracilariopsis chorda]|eukprot:PXF42144.1 Peroxinectin A [Gracilariopsis chorda]
MRSLIAFWVICALFSNTFAQPPRGNGRGAGFLRPAPPRSSFFTLQSGPISDINPECAAQTVRGLTGRCTSALDPNLGEARRPQFSYLDVNSVNFADDGLRSPREISNIVSDQSGNTLNSRRLNELFVFFGQFIDHDFASSPITDEEEPIEVPSDDPDLGVSTLGFERSLRSRISADSTIERPITVLSSALDLSTVYGVDLERNDFLRVPNSCRMKTSSGNNLPFNSGGFTNAPSSSRNFYIAGDTRVNEHPVLTTMHTIFLREHNRLCELIEGALPNMAANDMYEAARAINIAQYQKIIYEEWLPAILGRKLPRYTGYKPEVDPTISLEFTTAGFRLGHTMVGNGVSRIDANGRRLPLITMEQMFFRSSNLQEGDIENFIRGAAGTRAQEVDALVVDALRNFLFRNVPEEGGIDLISLNLQRGRDHNVPRFNELRRFFLGSSARSFQEISRDRTVQRKLQDAYGSVDNVEAWPGLMAEDKSGAAGIGRTNAELWKREFTRLRNGDRFFYLDNARHNQIPQNVLRALPEVDREIFSSQTMFSAILQRTTSIPRSRLSSGVNIFRAS